MPCYEWKCALIAIFGGVDISEVPWYDLLWQMGSHWGSQKLLQGLVSHKLLAYLSVFNLHLAQWIMVILSKGCKPGDKVQTDMRGLCLNFVECESYLESNTTDTLASIWDTLGWLNWFWQFLCDGLSSFNLKGLYSSYAWSCSLCERRILQILSYVFNWLYFTQCLTSFSSIDHLVHLYAWFFIQFHLM